MDFEDVQKLFEGRNCELIEREYKNDKKKMRYKCLIHPEKILQITYDKFRSGQRGCNQCSGRSFATYLEVKQAFEDRGYKLLETEYLGVDVKMKYECPKHPDKILSMTYSKLRNGRSCLYCYNPHYTGEGDVKWKGGVSSLNDVLRLQVKAWKNAGFKRIWF